MKVENMTSKNGNKIANQFIITSEHEVVFQSYNSIIVEITTWPDRKTVNLDINKWDYSTTTGKYRNQFLGETKKETEKKIKSGEYILVDLNN